MFKLYSIIFCISILREINMLLLHAEVATSTTMLRTDTLTNISSSLDLYLTTNAYLAHYGIDVPCLGQH